MIDHFNLAAPVKEVADLIWFDHGPLCGRQRDIMQKLTVLKKNWDLDIMRTAF